MVPAGFAVPYPGVLFSARPNSEHLLGAARQAGLVDPAQGLIGVFNGQDRLLKEEYDGTANGAPADRLRARSCVSQVTTEVTAKMTIANKPDLTDALIVNLQSKESEYFIWDARRPHLGLRIYPDGRRDWYYVRRIKMRLNKLKLGTWPRMPVHDARDKAEEIDGALEFDIQPGVMRQRLRKETRTYRQAFESYMDGHLRQHTAPRTVADAEMGFQRYCARFHDVPVAQIQSIDVQTWVNETAEEFGAATANKQFTFFKACLNWCLIHDVIKLLRDPTLGVKRFAEYGRERYVKPGDEFDRLMRALRNHPCDSSDAIELLLFTGLRKSNVLAMRWEHVDFANRCLSVPARTTKQRKPLVVPLTEAALNVLNRRSQLQVFTPWVFPERTRQPTKTGHIAAVEATWRIVRKEAGLSDMVLHDLRHTVGSTLGMSGASAFMIQRALGHSSSRMTERYTHLAVDPLRDAMEKAQQYLKGQPEQPIPGPATPPSITATDGRRNLRRVK